MGFFTDDLGRQAVAQRPNALILLWTALAAGSLVALEEDNRKRLGRAARVVLAVWAVLEAADGDSGFRRTAGALTLASLVRR
jgi:hypothetical protein